MRPLLRPTMSRRTLLRGAGGVAIALPMLEAMAPRQARAATEAPRRLLTFLNENGVVPSAWFPDGSATEKNFTMGPLLKSWVPHQKNVIMLDGLDNKASGGTCHSAARCGTLTGANNNGGRAVGASIDQAVANAISNGTRLKSLETSVFLKGNFVYGLFFSGPGQMVQPLDDPAAVFTRVFADGVPAAGGSTPDPNQVKDLEALRLRKKSILDRTMDEYNRVSGTVGMVDKQRLARHMDGIREIERGLDAIGKGGAGPSQACKLPMMETAIDFPKVTELQSKLVLMALACDITRVASIQTRASLTSFTWLGVNTGQHALSHQQGSPGADAQLNKIQEWFAQQASQWLIEGMKATADSDGRTLFDNTLLFWANDLGRGTHARQRYPFIFATGEFKLPGGKILETGRYLKYPGGTPHNNMLVSIARMFGLNVDKFGGYGGGPLPNFGV
jgi:hypothetical protein